MSKANQKFVQADEAVSPVIGVILMVAITVVLAAVVFVLVSNLSKGTGDANEAASVTASSPRIGNITITLIKAGSNAPYTFNGTGSGNSPEALVTLDGNTCSIGSIHLATASTEGNLTGSSDAEWSVGETVTLDTDCGSNSDLITGTDHFVTVSLHNTVILDNAKVTIP